MRVGLKLIHQSGKLNSAITSSLRLKTASTFPSSAWAFPRLSGPLLICSQLSSQPWDLLPCVIKGAAIHAASRAMD